MARRAVRILILLSLPAIACNFIPGQTDALSPSETATPADGTADETTSPTSTPTSETTTVFLMGEGEVQVPVPPPLSLDALLDQQVDSGDWAYGEGLVYLLRYVTGERGPDEIPGFKTPSELSPTGIVRQAQDYLNDPTSDPQYRSDVERLLGVLVPSQSVLDSISQPAERSSRGGVAPVAFHRQAGVPAECEDIETLGFSSSLDTGEYCYVFKEANTQNSRLRVYYPKWWQDDQAAMSWVEASLKSLSDSAPVYGGFGTFKDVNAIFSLSQPQDSPTTLAFETGFPTNEPCPVIILPLVYTDSQDEFLQTVAHEAFHCYQDWNFTTSPYRYHRWWAEGSAEYFSNVVYPEINAELGRTDNYYYFSLIQPWFDLDYLNFLLFQFLANKLGNEGVLILLDRVSSSGDVQAQAQTLAGYGDLDALFEEFVVATMSTGVQDTGGTTILRFPFPVMPVRKVGSEGDQTFTVDPFVAGRFGVDYLRERRFLQEPIEDGHVRHSAAAREQLKDPQAWSALPPEVRSQCEKDQGYGLALTSVQGLGKLTARVDKVEEAACDPCLLGTWDVDPDSFAAFIQRVTQSGGQLPGNSSLEIGIAGHNYVEFKIEGKIITRRADFRMRIAGSGSPGLITSIDSQGSATYSTDGKTMHVWNVQDKTNSITTTVEGSGLTISQTPDTITYNFFGNSTSTANASKGEVSQPQSTVGAYVCSQETLNVTTKDFGDVLFHRVDDIIPTPIPTPGP